MKPAFALLVLLACQRGDQGSDKPLELGKALKGAIVDHEIVLADAEHLRVAHADGTEVANLPAPGGIQVLAAAGGVIYAGWGATREHRTAPMKVAAYRLDGGQLVEDVIMAPASERMEVVAIVPGEHDVVVAYYSSKYVVKSVLAKRGANGWETTPVAEIRMATSYARGDIDGDGVPDLVVGRVYGDAQGVDGDAFVLAPDGTRTPIPTTRGVRGLAIADGAVWLGDGWHQSYAQQARGLVTVARKATGAFTSQLVEDTQGQFAIDKIVAARAGGQTVIVTLGSKYVRAFSPAGGAWQGSTIAGLAADIAVGDLDGQPGDEVLIVGDHTAVIHL